MSNWDVIARDHRDLLGEGPLWSERDQALYWVDILAPALRCLRLTDMVVTSQSLPQPTGWIIERQQAPGFIAGTKTGFAELRLNPFDIRPIGDPEPEFPANRMNDAIADSAGRIWAGTMGDGVSPSGSLYRLSPDHSWTKVDQGYAVPNGPAISHDGASLFHTDSCRGLVYRFDIDEAGQLSNRRVFLEFPSAWGSPDGMTFDAEGGLWIAHWGAGCISRFSMAGAREHVVSLPVSQITSLAFAGPELDRLFITSAAVDRTDEALAGSLFEVAVGVKGLKPHRFAG